MQTLPVPMLARSGPLPTGPGWSFEPKWDGFRAIVRAGDDYAVRSRRGWLMTELLREFARLSIRGVFDGELVAFGNDGKPSFRRICRRILERDESVPVALVVFDVLELDGETTVRLPYRRRRELLEALAFSERTWIKRKNPQWPRYEAEREAAIRERRSRRNLMSR